MSGRSALVLCRRCGWERPYEWFLIPDHDFIPGTTQEVRLPPMRVKECRACRDQWPVAP